MPDSTASFYAALPDVQKAFLRDFDATHTQTSLSMDGVIWSYYDSKEGEEVLLLLHGGYVDFSMWIHQIVEFEKDYRVIAPTCPPLPDARMKVYSDALYAILSAENVDRATVIGYSEGGLIAQCFLRDYPDLVDRVVLGHTFYPSRESRYYRTDFALFRLLPAFLTEGVFRLLAKPDKEELDHESTEWLEWFKGYFRELKANLTKEMIITHIDLMTDFCRNYVFSADDLSAWSGRMLITVSQDDVVFKHFEGLKRLYPQAEVHVFERGLGAHSLALISPQVFNRRIRQFLK